MKGSVYFLAVFLFLISALPVFGQGLDHLDGPEQQAMTDTVRYALENNRTNQPSEWVNPDTERSGSVVPTRTFDNAQGLPCREFITTIVIGGREEQGYGTACRQPDGSWQIANEPQSAQPPQRPVNMYVDNPPERYFYYPPAFYAPYRIYLSFGTVFRSGHHHRGSFYLGGVEFRHRHPVHVRERVFYRPWNYDDYRRHGGWEFDDRGRHRGRHGGKGWDDWDDSRHGGKRHRH